MARRIEVGAEYGMIKVISSSPFVGSAKKWTCICKRCGKQFDDWGTGIFSNQQIGCNECRSKHKADLRTKRRIEEAESCIGMICGSIEILGYSHMGERNRIFMNTRCLKCGNETKILLDRLKIGRSKQCAQCNRKNLEKGRDFTKIAAVDGTLITAIDGGRQKNKNNTTGYQGVSLTKYGYRAYINFRRKQYHLGVYKNIADAIEARKTAEKEMYGSFLEWYANTYPEQWEKINENKRKK